MILQADHDLNNLVAQFYDARLIAEEGQPGLGKGMDGAAGKDLLVRVPCGTMVWSWKLLRTQRKLSKAKNPALFLTSISSRPIMRRAGAERALEVEPDLEEPPVLSSNRGDLIADLTEHGQQFVLCKGGRGGLGNRNFATARRQTPRFAQAR